MKSEEKAKARELRKNGMSVRNIAKLIGVSIGSASVWVRDIILTEKQIITLQANNPIYDRQHKGAQARKQKAYLKRKEYQEAGKLKAKEKSFLHQAGCMLYWAEGSKGRDSCNFSNSDPHMLKLFLTFLFKEYKVSQDRIKIHVNCYTTNGLSVLDIEEYWSKTLSLPKTCFTKTTTNKISIYSQKKKAKNKLLYGTVSIRVLSGIEIVQNIFGAIQEYGGFNTEFCIN